MKSTRTMLVIAVAATGMGHSLTASAATDVSSTTLYRGAWKGHQYSTNVLDRGRKVMKMPARTKRMTHQPELETWGLDRDVVNVRIDRFVRANFGKPATICALARAGSNAGVVTDTKNTISLEINGFAAGTQSSKVRSFKLGTRYATRCMNFRVISEAGYAVATADFPANVKVTSWNAAAFRQGPTFVHKVVIKLR